MGKTKKEQADEVLNELLSLESALDHARKWLGVIHNQLYVARDAVKGYYLSDFELERVRPAYIKMREAETALEAVRLWLDDLAPPSTGELDEQASEDEKNKAFSNAAWLHDGLTRSRHACLKANLNNLQLINLTRMWRRIVFEAHCFIDAVEMLGKEN